jgi:hypothetical protein
MTVKILPWLRFLLLVCVLIMPLSLFAADRGIYISQTTLENSKELQYLIDRSKKVGINTFVIDLERISDVSEKNIKLVLSNNLKYIARIIMFPGGGTDEQMHTEAYWQRKIKLVQKAVEMGASEIQLDYIRYNTARGASPQHAKDVYKIISWYKSKLNEMKIPLQVDVFGITSFGEEKHIGQSVTLFADTVNTMCPMVYPSHFEPYLKHAVTPYETVYDALVSLRQQFDGALPFKLNPYIELSNYRYPLSREKKYAYIRAQLKAVKDANADGWYAWSPSNWYDNLFTVLEQDGGGANNSNAKAERTVKTEAVKTEQAENDQRYKRFRWFSTRRFNYLSKPS